jgi:hypothetical protein
MGQILETSKEAAASRRMNDQNLKLQFQNMYDGWGDRNPKAQVCGLPSQ